MANEEKQRPSPKPHTVILEERSRLTVSGVEDVDSFDESQIAAYTARGSLIIRGSGLHISKLTLDTGEMKVEGEIDALDYEDTAPASGFWQRLFG